MIFKLNCSKWIIVVMCLIAGVSGLFSLPSAWAQNKPPVTISLSLSQTVYGIKDSVKGHVVALDDQNNLVTKYPGNNATVYITVSLDATHRVTVASGNPDGFTIPTDNPFLDSGVYTVTASDATDPKTGATRMTGTTSQVTLVKLVIKRDGVDITDPLTGAVAPFKQVSVGEMMNLSVEVKPAVVVNSPTRSWSIPGVLYENWVATGTSSYPKNVSLEAMSKSPISFYWVDGSDTRTVTCSLTSPGADYFSLIGKATFKVTRPEIGFTIQATGVVALDYDHPDADVANGLPALHYGIPNAEGFTGPPGIKFQIPGLPKDSYGTNYQLVQVASLQNSIKSTGGWSDYQPQQGADTGGRTIYHYPFIAVPFSGVR